MKQCFGTSRSWVEIPSQPDRVTRSIRSLGYPVGFDVRWVFDSKKTTRDVSVEIEIGSKLPIWRPVVAPWELSCSFFPFLEPRALSN